MNKHQIKSNKTKNKIIKTYMSIYEKKDISKITIKEIADKSNYNRGTFYLYYKDIYDLHDKIKIELLNNIKTKIELLLEENILDFDIFFKTLISFFEQNENYLITLITHDNNFSEDIKKIMKNNLTKILRKDITNNKYTDYLIEYHISSVFSLITYWVKTNKNISKEELFTLFKEIITKGVFTVMREVN